MSKSISLDLAGRVALVTGAASGIGKAIATRLSECGADIVVNTRRDHAGAESVVGEVRALGRLAEFVIGDVSTPEGAQMVVRSAAEAVRGPDIVVNNVGPFVFSPLADLTPNRFAEVVNANLNSAFNVSHAALSNMRSARYGAIVNVGLSCVVHDAGGPGIGPYAVAKGALAIMTRSMAAELACENIRVMMVAPGLIDTENLPSAQREWMLQRVPSGRLGTPQEVANVVAFLASDLASYMSGCVVSVAGGWSWDEDRSTRHDSAHRIGDVLDGVPS